MRKFKFISILLVLSMLLTVPAFAFSLDFTDVPENAVYAESVSYLAEAGILRGTASGRFAPNSSLEYFAEFFAYWCSSNTRALALLKELTPETYAYFEGLTKVQKELLVQMQKTVFYVEARSGIMRAGDTNCLKSERIYNRHQKLQHGPRFML